MAIKFKPLQHSTTEEIRNCFNESFKDYFVPFHLTKEQFENKLAAEAIDLSLSFGVFENDQLAGFILNGIDIIDGVKTAYNGGTGILPQYRGKGLSLALYEYCIGALKKAAVEKTVLEVFQQNTAAIKTYQKAGFEISKKINSYKGRPNPENTTAVEIQEQQTPDWNWIDKYTAWQPAWQYNTSTLQRGWHQYRLFTAYENEAAASFIIFNAANGRVARFGSVHSFDAPEYLIALFAHITSLYKEDITIAHIGNVAAEDFLQRLGLQAFVYSYEMEQLL